MNGTMYSKAAGLRGRLISYSLMTQGEVAHAENTWQWLDIARQCSAMLGSLLISNTVCGPSGSPAYHEKRNICEMYGVDQGALSLKMLCKPAAVFVVASLVSLSTSVDVLLTPNLPSKTSIAQYS